jgi:PhnB protein
MSFTPYLNFNGTCRAAMTRYQEILGGELYVMGADDLPADESITPDWNPELVVHAALRVDGSMIMASDAPGSGPSSGTHVHWEAKDVEDAKRVFEALAEGGEVDMAIEETFWAPAFGSCTDRWGTLWMVSAPGSHELPD